MTHDCIAEDSPSILWQMFKSLYLNLKCEVRLYQNLKIGITLFVVSLKNIVSLSRDRGDILKQVSDCLLPRKLIGTLRQDYELKSGKMEFTGIYNPRHFLNLFSINSVESSELVWNSEARGELMCAIEEHRLKGSSLHEILGFSYSIYRRELIVEGVFIRHYNTRAMGDSFNPEDP